jgi:hypothetical protein
MISKIILIVLIIIVFVNIYKYLFIRKEKLINLSSDYLIRNCDVAPYIKLHDKIDVIVNGYSEEESKEEAKEEIINNCKMEGTISSDCVNKVLSYTNSLEEAEKLCTNTKVISENCFHENNNSLL